MLVQNSFLITVSKQQNSTPTRYFCDNHVHVDMKAPNENYIVYQEIEERGFRLFFGERKDGPFNSFDKPVNGTSVIYTGDGGELDVIADQVGAECLFYKATEEVILLSNRLENLVAAGEAPDWTAIHCFLSFGYTLKSSTFFKGIRQTLPYQRISVTLPGLESREEFRRPQLPNPDAAAEPEIVERFSRRFSEILGEYSPMVLMMSAGWDSRTLLAPKDSPVTAAYTHGDLSSREITIAKKLTGHVRKDHLFKDARNLKIDKPLLDELLEKNGHCLWPIWHVSSEVIAEAYKLPITSGVIGARVGGHNGFASMGSRGQRVINALHLVSPNLISRDKILQDLKRSLTVPERFWFTSRTGHELFLEERPESNRELHAVLDEYVTAYEDFPTAIERFNYDHVSRQYMMKQPSMARGTLGYYSPLSHPDLLDIAYSLPFKSRLHNKVSQKVIRQHNPDLLQFPMAATLAKAKRPIFTQELSRILRLVGEQFINALGWKRPSLGWFNYEHLYAETVFTEIVDSLTSDLWSKQKMKEVIASHPAKGVDAGSTLDMLCKVKTVDYYLDLSKYKHSANFEPEQ